MLCLILTSLKHNTSLPTEAQVKHGGNRKQGWRPPTVGLAAAGGTQGRLRALFGLTSDPQQTECQEDQKSTHPTCPVSWSLQDLARDRCPTNTSRIRGKGWPEGTGASALHPQLHREQRWGKGRKHAPLHCDSCS